MRKLFARQPDWSAEPVQRPDPLCSILLEEPWTVLVGRAVCSVALCCLAVALWPVIRKRRFVEQTDKRLEQVIAE